MMPIYALVALLVIALISVVYQTFKKPKQVANEELSNLHLFTEKPTIPSEVQKESKILFGETKKIVLAELQKNGIITNERAKELNVKRLPSVIFNLRKKYNIQSVVVKNEFKYYKFNGKKTPIV